MQTISSHLNKYNNFYNGGYYEPESVKFGFIQRSELFQTLTFVEID